MSNPAVVRIWTEKITLPTFLPQAPDRNPMFLERRVYQGSNGKVYPLPFIDRIAETKTDRLWDAVWLENEFLRVLVLPEIGGRIHAIQDKITGCDLIYRQDVIKPALVGLAGPWVSGGIEFNWPQHHRPATFMPVDFELESAPDGSATVWCGDHDPMARMKGMHGVCLRPGLAYVELKVRACNRTPFVQTFLWWANVATRVHEAYQSFFPPDVYYVADHARRSMSEYPLCQGAYYGVNYAARGREGIPADEVPSQFQPPPCRPVSAQTEPQSLPAAVLPNYAPNDLSFYANIPVPTSYMCMGSQEDFFGGYDYRQQVGLVHIANHHIAPGKKQWTWGNHPFGYAWDRNLTEPDANGEYGPYIEIMAGVYTDNQPDFSFLQPGETKSWTQFWYPIHQIGPAQHANLDAAISISRSGIDPNQALLRVGVSVTRAFPQATLTIATRAPHGQADLTTWVALARFTRDLLPGQPLLEETLLPKNGSECELRFRLVGADGREILSYQPQPRRQREVPPPATEPLAPDQIASADELYVTGLHLEQYRHATRCPTLYWREALRRDPLDARCNNALGLWHLRRGEFQTAEACFRKAIERLTRRNANPYDGEPYYNLGLCLRFLGRDVEAYAAFYKSTWNQAWQAAAYHALAELDSCQGRWSEALDHLDRALRLNVDHLRARNLKAIVLQKLGRAAAAQTWLNETLARDPLDWWARYLLGHPVACDSQTRLDITLDFVRAGLWSEALAWLQSGAPARLDDPRELGTGPLVQYYLAWLHSHLGNVRAAMNHYRQAAALPPDYCFPARLEEIPILQAAIHANPADARAPFYLGNLLYDRRRHQEAITLWESSARLDPAFSVVWRNLGIGYFNIRREAARARRAYDHAVRANPADARLLYERDQLWKRLGESPGRRLRELKKHLQLVRLRDDLSLELCALYNQTGQHARALDLVRSRRFQPWEGGEGGPLGQHVRAHLALGRQALARGDAEMAREHFEAAGTAPPNLGEARHLLANQSDLRFWLGCACRAQGDAVAAQDHWRAAAAFKGDFQEMSLRAFSEMTYYSALAWERLGEKAKARQLLRELLAYAQKLARTPARIDYFATSLPTMLLFEDDLQARQQTTALLLQAQARLGLRQHTAATQLLRQVLQRDPNQALAADLLASLEPPPRTRSRRPLPVRAP